MRPQMPPNLHAEKDEPGDSAARTEPAIGSALWGALSSCLLPHGLTQNDAFRSKRHRLGSRLDCFLGTALAPGRASEAGLCD